MQVQKAESGSGVAMMGPRPEAIAEAQNRLTGGGNGPGDRPDAARPALPPRAVAGVSMN